MTYEPLSPVDVEAKLRSLVTELTKAQAELRDARDAETNAEIEHRKARLKAAHSDHCPVVSRGGPTVADRDAWIDREAFREWAAHQWAVTVRETAQDNLRTVRDIAEVVRSLSASVRAAYQMAGSS